MSSPDKTKQPRQQKPNKFTQQTIERDLKKSLQVVLFNVHGEDITRQYGPIYFCRGGSQNMSQKIILVPKNN